MIKHRRIALLVLLLVLAPTVSAASALAVDDTGTASAPITLNPEQIQAMQDAADGQSNDRSVFEKVSDFVTDNAPFFIIGIVVIAAIAAGILILRGRSRSPGASKASGAAASGGTAAERRRRKRIETQRAREEERIRRQTRRRAGARHAATPPPAAYASDPDRSAIEAEKLGADQDRAAAAVARARGPVAAPYSPSQTAPAPGVVTEPPAEPWPGTGPATGPDPGYPVAQPTAAFDLPPGSPGYEPSLESPGPDATVGRNAAAFAAAAGAGAVAGRAVSRDAADDAVVEPYGETGGIPPAADEFPARPGPVYDERLRSTLDDLRSARFAPAPSRPALPGPALAGRDPEGETGTELQESDLSLGLAAIERRLSAERDQRDRVLQDAEERLHRIEQRAEDAERRAAFAERLAHLKVEESEREERLRSVMSGIERAERRASEAEERARAAELSAAAALEGKPAEPESVERMDTGRASGGRRPVAAPREPAPGADKATAPVEKGDVPPSGGITSSRAAGTASDTAGDDDRVSLNDATFEQLRGLGLSVTQATRILAYRERFGGYNSLDDLDKVPGFTPEKIESMRSRFTI